MRVRRRAAGLPDNRPCGYLLFGLPYERMAQNARKRGSDVDQIPGRQSHQLVGPDAVTAVPTKGRPIG
ncbi:hypothetical protein [Rugosimonospora africana]|uniref:Uncharacterized protein n=1 Tax=Rugosimonospora africana TaxID=556532 RepID=A0A8J3R0X6_9ACTN|nr:hypothetical protein [Rugosimonospora africana]GIH19607.1 hypothetical protein Raf01_77790 [Rugosimonospora africana]